MGVVDQVTSAMAAEHSTIPEDVAKLLRIGDNAIKDGNVADPE